MYYLCSLIYCYSMNLTLDIGNSYIKCAVFDQTELVDQTLFHVWNPDFVISWLSSYSVDQAIVSSVRIHGNQPILEDLKHWNIPLIILSSDTQTPIINRYLTAQTLGKDRLAAAVGAYSLYPGRAILIIDAGTAITYDFITTQAEFMGGNIAPGKQMRFQALHSFTDGLPMLDEQGAVKLLGDSTDTAIRSGVIQGIVFEIEGYMRRLQEDNPSLLTFLTGGDANLLQKSVNFPTFANKNLVLIGLNAILQYNANK